MMRWLRAILAMTFLWTIYGYPHDITNEERISLTKTITDILGYQHIPERESALTMMSRIPSYLSRRMEAVFEDLQETDHFPDGNIVRALLPRLGKANGNEALLFDVQIVSPYEKILRVELHFHLPQASRHGSKRRSKAVRASALCNHQFCRGPYTLPHIEATRTTAVMDATLPFAQLHAINGSVIAVTMWRKDIKMRSSRELVKRNPPFLLVFTEGEPIKDLKKSVVNDESLESSSTRHKLTVENRIIRAKRDNGWRWKSLSRSRDSDYFKYNDPQQGKIQMKASLRKLNKAQLEEEKQKKDPWYGFGDEAEEEDEDSEEEEEEEDLGGKTEEELVLLNRERSCSLSRRMISTSLLGLDHVILSPPSIDLSQCQGNCDRLAKRWSPRALFLGNLSSFRSSICCSPSRLQPMIFMFLDDLGNLSIRLFPRLVARNCECL